MTFQRPPRPDIFEMLLMARQRVFVRCGEDDYLIVSALRNSTCLMRFCKGEREVQEIRYFDQSAEQLGLFNGSAWDLAKLTTWLESISPDKHDEEVSK